LRFPVDARSVLVKRLDQPLAFFGRQAGVELRHREIDAIHRDCGGVYDPGVAFPHTFQIDLLHCANGIPHRLVDPDRGEAGAVQFVVEVIFKFQSFIHDFIIFTI